MFSTIEPQMDTAWHVKNNKEKKKSKYVWEAKDGEE